MSQLDGTQSDFRIFRIERPCKKKGRVMDGPAYFTWLAVLDADKEREEILNKFCFN